MVTISSWDEEQRRARPSTDPPCVDADAPAAVLALARDLADRLARTRMSDPASLRLARAMALNIVDLLEES